MTRYQWTLIALLSANFGVVFFDRNTISYLGSFIQEDLKLSNAQLGYIPSAFSLGWALAGVCMGALVERLHSGTLLKLPPLYPMSGGVWRRA